VSGLLLILFGKTRKILHLISKLDKEYICLMQLHSDVDEKKLRETISMFVGKIYQKPPLRSAVKKQPRIREVYSIEILEILGRNVLMKVHVEAGTYIRKLCFDIGEILGSGAHMAELRRIKIGNYNENYKYVATLHELFGAYREWKINKDERYLRFYIRPLEELVFNLPRIYVKDTSIYSISHGSFVAAPAVLALTSDISKDSFVTICNVYNEVIAIGKSQVNLDEAISLKKGIIASVDTVLINPI